MNLTTVNLFRSSKKYEFHKKQCKSCINEKKQLSLAYKLKQ